MSGPPAGPVTAARGVRALRQLLREQTLDLRRLDLAGFRGWLVPHQARWQQGPVFVQRARIRDLRRSQPRLRALEREHRRAARLADAAPQADRLRHLERELFGVNRAIAGLTAALEESPAEKRPALAQKRQAFQARQRGLQEEQAQLIQASPERQTLLRLDAELQQLRGSLGLDRAEAHLEQLTRQQGQRSGRSGSAFEELALALTQRQILPDLLRRSTAEEARRRVRILRGVTLGAARTELDQLVIRQPRRDGGPVEVLAVVESKRNINDLAHGFRQRQENLAWLTGDTARYEPGLYRTTRFRSGHFDRDAVHREDGDTFRFRRSSFRLFRSGPGGSLLLKRLYFITRPGALWGVSTAALARIGFRVSTDEQWDPGSEAYLGRLLHWCQSLAEPLETPDVLRLYAGTARRGRQILLAER